MNTQACSPARAAAAPTAPARLPVEEQDRVCEAEVAGGLEGDGDDPVLEGVGGVAGVVLDVQRAQAELAGQVVGRDEPGPARVQVRLGRDVGRDRQQRSVAPDVGGPRRDQLAGHGAALREVVGDLQRPETLAHRRSAGRAAARAALAAGERDGGAERRRWWSGRGCVSGHEARPFPHLPRRRSAGRNWHLSRPGLASAGRHRDGCRGFVGPFPPPLWMSCASSVVRGAAVAHPVRLDVTVPDRTRRVCLPST